MMPLYNYLNLNLQVLAEYLSKHLLMKVMLATWAVVVSSADELLLPKLASATTFHLSNIGSKLKPNNALIPIVVGNRQLVLRWLMSLIPLGSVALESC